VVSISPEQIEDAIREILATELEVDMGEYGVDASGMPLLGRGIGLDSIDALTLITALEKRFDIEVPDEDLTVALFKSIRVLAEYVAEKTSAPKSEVSSPAR
jgi:acyl carrier protein